jgi:hypothetical protein
MTKTVFYLLKVHGQKDNIDYIQIRDGNLSLLANLRIASPYDNIIRFFNSQSKAEKVVSLLPLLPTGKLTKIEL